jgi:hypothetical protein
MKVCPAQAGSGSSCIRLQTAEGHAHFWAQFDPLCAAIQQPVVSGSCCCSHTAPYGLCFFAPHGIVRVMTRSFVVQLSGRWQTQSQAGVRQHIIWQWRIENVSLPAASAW